MLSIEKIIEVVLLLVPLVTFAYKFWKGRAKINELKDACKSALNANKEMLPLVEEEKLKLAIETKISVLELLVALIEGGVISDNFTWELDEKVKAAALGMDHD